MLKISLKLTEKQTIKMPKKGEYIKFKKSGRKIKSPFMIYADFESILVGEDSGKQNANESCQKHVACVYGCKLVCVDDTFSMSFESYLSKDAVYNFIIRVVEERKYCNDVTKKTFNKELVMTKDDNEKFENSAIC